MASRSLACQLCQSPCRVTSRALGEELLSHPVTSVVPFSSGVWGCPLPSQMRFAGSEQSTPLSGCHAALCC